MPTTEIMTAAATTAFISVAATLTATSIFKHCIINEAPIQTSMEQANKEKEPNPS